MNKLSLQPDLDIRWIYDPSHPEYSSPRAQALRDARARAIANAPQWMREDAALNDALAAAHGVPGWLAGIHKEPHGGHFLW